MPTIVINLLTKLPVVFGSCPELALARAGWQIQRPWAADMAIRREHRKRAVACSEHEPRFPG
jgi:hypothetical protein